MNLFILRHGIAVERGASGFSDDARRPLMVKGEERIQDAARAMQALELSFDSILSSPYLRASQTAKIVTRTFKCGDLLEFSDHLTPEGDPKALIRQINQFCPARENILLVGHEPYLSRFISLLVSGEDRLAITLKKGGLARLEVERLQYGRCATLAWLLTPKQLGLMD